MRVRVRLNAGEPIAAEEDLFGAAVNLAARICAHAEPGQILAPIVVRELAAGKQFLFAANADLLRELAELDVDSLAPLQALTKLYELAERARASQP